ncbi:MAG: AMP-binding protein, partial [bacterium]|nr:AMP-binding protein [bacterium]
LGEIENQLLAVETLREAIVVDRKDNDGTHYLVAYYTAPEKTDPEKIKEKLAQTLPDYMIPAYLTQLDNIPLTPNGKVDRKGLPAARVKSQKKYNPPRDTVEKELVEIWVQILFADPEKQLPPGIDDNFFQLGGHSLKATILAARIHKKFHVKLPLAKIFKKPTIRDLAGYIKTTAENKYISVPPAEKKNYYTLSPAQKRLYILHRMTPESSAYNMPKAIPLPGKPDLPLLEKTFLKLMERHESLRTSFHMINQQPVQKIHDMDEISFKIEYYEAAGGRNHRKNRDDRNDRRQGTDDREEINIINRFNSPFELTEAPCMKVGVLKNGTNSFLLLVVMHHIISDGVSQGILQKDFLELYQGITIPPLRIQYKDYSEWQNREKENLKQQEKYWLNKFEENIPVLDLPADFPRPAVQDYAGGLVNFEIPAKETRALKTIAREEEVTLYMLLLTVYVIFLSKLCNQEDVIVGTPVAGRRHNDLETIIGMFVNTLALRSHPGGEKTFKQYLAETKKETLNAFENQEYPFEELVEKVLVNRDAARNPLFDVMYTLNNSHNRREKIEAGENTSPLHSKQKPAEKISAKFDLSMDAVENDDVIIISIVYCTKLFKEETVKRFFQYLKKIVSEITGRIDTTIAGIEILSAEEKNKLIYQFNNTAADYSTEKLTHELFERQVERTPDRTAVVGAVLGTGNHYPAQYPAQLTYRELNNKANQLARRLKEEGVTPGTIVAIKLNASLEMITGLLGILKSGGAYLPIDPI